MKTAIDLADLLKKALEKEITVDYARNQIGVSRYLPYLSYVHFSKGHTIAMMGDPITKAFIILKGSINCIKYGADGRMAIVNDTDDILYGLDEILTGNPYCYASMVTITEIDAIVINSQYLLEQIRKDLATSNVIVDYLMKRVMRHMTSADSKILYTDYHNMLLFLSDQCASMRFPVEIRIPKKHIAEILGINLRTIYRYMKTMKEEGLISGKERLISISKEQYMMIQDLLNEA